MRSSSKALFYFTLAFALGANAFAQRGFGGGAAIPSSTAFGAGATIAGRAAPPSSTAIGAGAPARGAFSRGSFSNGGTSPAYYNGRNNSRSGYGRNSRNSYPYGAFLTPYYYPFFDSGSAPYGPGPDDMPYDPNLDPAVVTQRLIGDQVQRLTAEVQQMKYAQQQQPQMQAAAEPSAPAIPVTVVLRNGQKLQVQNYAVMDNVFWDFSKQPARKIPISTIDVAASTQATAANGAEFPQVDPNQ